MEQIVQKECEVSFALAHRAPIMKTALVKKSGCLEDEVIAKEMVEGTYGIPSDLYKSTRCILGEISYLHP